MALPMRIHFGVDLVDQATSHIAFLKAVNSNKELRDPEVLKRALYRYEKFWLPLAAEHPREYLSGPMDIEWVWHCHMLSPKTYEKDCYNIVRMTVNHAILRPDEFQRSRNKAHAYWSEKNSEPFYIDYGATFDMETISGFTSQISYDILSAVERQRSFLYQVSLPHYLDRKFLESGLLRYKQFLLLKRQYPNEFLVPCYDIDLMWHTHQLNPIIYKNDTMRIVGQLFNHDDSVNERHEGSKLNTADKRTRDIWKQVYNESFSKFGAMFRGNPPDGSFYTITQKDEFSFCTKSCLISLDSLTLQIPSPDLSRSKYIELKASSAKVSRQEVAKWFKLKRPANSKPGNPTISWSKVGSFNFSTKNEHGILFSIHQKTGLLGTKTEVDSNFLDIIPIVESPVNATKPGGIVKRRLTFKGNTTLDVQGHFQQPSIGDVFLFLEEGTYGDGVISDDVRMILGPLGMKTPHSETESRCNVAIHKLKNHLRNTAIEVRTIHSTFMMTSVIQVLYQDKQCAVAHLIGADQLPVPGQVSHNLVTLNPKLGERAILIKNGNGDWGIVCGHWTGLRKGVPPSRGRAGIPGSPGTLRLKFYKMSTGEVIQFDLGYGQKLYSIHIDSTRVDLKNGIIQINPQSNEVVENVSLVFAISLLHVLCVPRPRDWKEGQQVSVIKNRGARSIESVPSDSMSCVRAAGLLVKTPSNHYIANTYGNRLCLMCFGSHECHDMHGDLENERDNPFCVDNDFGQTGYDVGGGGADAGCGGCGGCGGEFSGDGGISGGGGDGGGGWDGGGGGDGGGDGGGASCGGCAGCRD